ncbi:TonB-dependent receptor [Xanthomonas arboricola]|uniref:TonB-dependent receptor n=3 Tax=Xanthomonas arboricola pv. pruni TaxID=69929 RepID=A0AAP4NIX0_9XANT|nr:TonB-dependent receptor [Xanthomonas arboricola]GAE55837.1 hypothetical protein XPR_2472 [Xanthomonas arboricola pv. pruni MAFF 301420]GAE58435.1 hypothetical protein XPN_0341 [Xanthomonas arboricola pv. pruni MAFF 301427]KPN09820.1 TonB-dependent receptor [Xanthomonas arboricola pv. pruni]MDN0268162.1 TonB-dependent receptor [Xanthomonas arboricola pv. pruni]MDN0272371.1 TonB-dependent receptor [Xanthomonas arboricola pv. pruni]
MPSTVLLAARSRSRHRADALAAAIVLALLPVAALAGSGNDDAKQATDLPTVTVSARLADESAKDVPFGLSVIPRSDIEAGRLLNIKDVLRNTPGVDVSSYGGSNDGNVRIRGVGSLNQVSMDDGSVVLNVDGVAISMRHTSLATFDVEQVEVLKGPQGTLFGRNSEAGAINVTSRRPTRERQGYVRVEAGEQGQHLQEAAVGGALSERISGRIALRNSGYDAWVDNAQDGRPLVEPSETAMRGSLLWDLADSTKALLILEGQNTRHEVAQEVLRPFGEQPSLDLTPGVFDGNRKQMRRYSLQIDHDLDNSHITSITAHTSADFTGGKGYDRRLTQALFGSAFEYLATDFSEERVNSQDLRWSSLPQAQVFWVTGVNLLHSQRSFDSLFASTGNQQLRDFGTDSYALYGETTLPLGEAFKLTGGLRYSRDRKTYRGLYSVGGSAVGDSRRVGDDYLTGRTALSYAWTDTTNVYAVYARGYKSQGFNDYATQPIDSRPYRAATVNSSEIGFKHASADQRFSLDGAVYLNQVRDDHLLGYDITTLAVSTVNADTRSKGAELQGNWHLPSGWTLGAGLSYIDADITSTAVGVSGGDVAAGNRVPDVAHLSGNLSIAYHRELAQFWGLAAPALNARLGYRGVGNRPANPQNNFDLAGYQKIDLRIGLENGNAELYAWADNLGDDRYDLYGNYAAPGVITGLPARGRTLGLGFEYFY